MWFVRLGEMAIRACLRRKDRVFGSEFLHWGASPEIGPSVKLNEILIWKFMRY